MIQEKSSCNGIDLQVIHAAEDALLRHAPDTGHEAVSQAGIILEGTGEQIAHDA